MMFSGVRAAFRSAMLAGSCSAWSTASSLTARCLPTRRASAAFGLECPPILSVYLCNYCVILSSIPSCLWADDLVILPVKLQYEISPKPT